MCNVTSIAYDSVIGCGRSAAAHCVPALPDRVTVSLEGLITVDDDADDRYFDMRNDTLDLGIRQTQPTCLDMSM